MRLIDADKLLKDMKRVCKGNCKRCEDYTILSSDLHCGLVDRQPTIQPQGIDKDMLIELLNTDMSGCDGDFAEEMAEIIIENMQQPTTDGWIPVSSGELPKNGTIAFVTDCFGTVCVSMRENDRWYCEAYYYDDKEVVAWQPIILPQPYKENM